MTDLMTREQFSESFWRVMFLYFSPFPTPASDRKAEILDTVSRQAVRTFFETGYDARNTIIHDEDVAALVATLLWTDLAETPNVVSLAEAMAAWRVAEAGAGRHPGT